VGWHESSCPDARASLAHTSACVRARMQAERSADAGTPWVGAGGLTQELPWCLTLHFSGVEAKGLLPYQGEASIKSHFRQALKEASSLRFGWCPSCARPTAWRGCLRRSCCSSCVVRCAVACAARSRAASAGPAPRHPRSVAAMPSDNGAGTCAQGAASGLTICRKATWSSCGQRFTTTTSSPSLPSMPRSPCPPPPD
jgi:hypothetical protein